MTQVWPLRTDPVSVCEQVGEREAEDRGGEDEE